MALPLFPESIWALPLLFYDDVAHFISTTQLASLDVLHLSFGTASQAGSLGISP